MNGRVIRLGAVFGLAAAALTGLDLAAQQLPEKTNPVLSDELNKRLPKWLSLSGEYRARAEGFTGGGFKQRNDDLYFLNRLRLNMKTQPESWLKLGIQGRMPGLFSSLSDPAHTRTHFAS